MCADLQLDYAPRRIRFQRLVERSGWRWKCYQILHGDKEPDAALADAALTEAERFGPAPETGPEHYRVGFVGVHQGARYDFVMVGFWSYGSELRLQAFMRPSTNSYRLEPVASGELSADVWDLKLLAFERDAWVRHALEPERADLEGYLADRLDAVL